ncbi:MAG: hypothetical protein LAN71_09280 [Acidobacteriia bacterium]|nr:hypothetical protein [Terriglobia bacterium]
MRALANIVKHMLFWSYDRGAWQYDLAVVAILIFVLATPRGWFQDQPSAGLPSSGAQVVLVSEDGGRRTYRVDARVIAPPMRPELANDLHKALQRTVPELSGKGFKILSIKPVLDDQGTVNSYEVQIQP